MVPLIPFYYVALVVVTVLFANYNPYFTLPEVTDKIGGYLDAASRRLFGTELSLVQKDQQSKSLIPLDFPKIKSLICQNSKVVASIDKVTSLWDTYVLPYILKLEKILEPAFLKLEEAFTPLVVLLKPYWISLKKFVTPYINIAKDQTCAVVHSLKQFLAPYFKELDEIYVFFSNWLKTSYQKYLEGYVIHATDTLKLLSLEIQLWYETNIVPFAEEHQTTFTVLVSALSLSILIPFLLPPTKRLLKYVTKDAYNLGNGINSMYNTEDKTLSESSSGVSSGITSREGTPVGLSGDASHRAKKA